jgi:iron complex transport system ATP-binding protein
MGTGPTTPAQAPGDPDSTGPTTPAQAPGDPDGTGPTSPARELCDPDGAGPDGAGPAARLVDAVARWLGHPERRVAASLVVLGYAARLVGPTLAVLLRDGILLDAGPDRVHYAYTAGRGFVLTLPEPAGRHTPPEVRARAWCATVIDEHLQPVVHAVRAVVPVAAGLLWGNVASGITGALRALPEGVPLAARHDTGLAILDHGPLRGTGYLTIHNGQLAFRRRSCCLYYRLPGGGTCGDCPLSGPG